MVIRNWSLEKFPIMSNLRIKQNYACSFESKPLGSLVLSYLGQVAEL